MQPDIQSSSISGRSLWAGRIISGLAVLFLLFDGVIHVLRITPVVEAFAQLGYPLGVAVSLGIVELVWGGLYLRDGKVRALIPLRR